MNVIVYSAPALTGGQSQKVTTSTSSAQSTVLNTTVCIVVVDALTFMRKGSNPTAVSDGTDQVLVANQQYRIDSLAVTDRLAFIVPTGTGNAYITPVSL